MAGGYLADAIGLPINAPALAVLAIAGFAIAIARRAPDAHPAARAARVLIVVAFLAYFLWLASPSLLPVTNGPDVVHHLQLVHFISTTGRLPRDPALGGYLLEMMGYTPGAHVIAAVIAAWLRIDPLRVVYPIAAFFAALQAGLIYDIARRVRGTDTLPPLVAAAAPLLSLAPAAYTLGAFVQFFYFGQVISQTFALGMVLAALAWVQSGRWQALVFAGTCAVGVALAWPMWLGPCGATLAAAILFRPSTFAARAMRLAAAMGPAAVVVALHQARHPSAASIVTSTGAVTTPSIAVFGIAFLGLAMIGAALALRNRSARLVLIFLAAIAAQSAALAALSMRSGSVSLYLPFKMVYLAVPAAAVLGTLSLGALVTVLVERVPRARAIAGWIPLLVAAVLLHGRVPVTRVHGWISLPARDVGVWARAHVPVACVDYFSRYWLTGYWLHLDVLGNPRVSARMSAETFEFRDAAAKWIEGRGLPYAIVEDLPSLPRDVREDMSPVYQQGAFTLVRNRRPATCP